MAARLSFFSLVLSVCISMSSIMCAMHTKKPFTLNDSSKSSAFNIEKPGLAVVVFAGQSISPVQYFPVSIPHIKLKFKSWLFEKVSKTSAFQLITLSVKNVIYVFVSIHAP